MAEVATQWEGQVVNGVYPLRRLLNASDHSSVFLTESTTEGFFNAAIKLVPADPAFVDMRLWQWKTAATFSHPHLMRLLDSGQCEIDGRPLLFVVMEYAEETLSQILPYRALAPEEVRELLVPTLEALASLHRENWVQGQLKPANFLVVNDQLKLAIDTIRPVGISRDKLARPSLYDPPEVERGEITLAADIWALGVTLVEALTQYPPTWLQGRSDPASLPTNLPAEFADIVQQCLSVNPADRPTLADLQLLTRPSPAAPYASPAPPMRQQTAIPAPRAPQEPVTAAVGQEPVTPAVGREAATPATPEPAMRAMRAIPPHWYSASSRYSNRAESAGRNWLPLAIVGLVVGLVAVWGGSRLFHSRSGGHPSADATSQGSAQQEAAPMTPPGPAPEPAPPVAKSNQHDRSSTAAPTRQQPQGHAEQRPVPAEQHGARAANNSAAVVHEEIPKVPQSARQTIHGHVRVSVRVTVNRSGNVVRDTFENASSSKYFNRVASEAARKWRFASADSDRTREWLLHFEFGREGTTVHATRSRS
jgi:TonB family protein